MAKEFYGYFDSTQADVREYDAGQHAQLLRAMTQDGVTSHRGGLAVSADGADMRVKVAPGGCLINGYLYVLEDDGGELKTFQHTASAASDRYDRIIVRLNLTPEERNMGLYLLTGVPGPNPKPPELRRDSFVQEVSLARVRIRAGSAAIEANDVEDERGDESVCGYAVPRWQNLAALDSRYGQLATAEKAGRMSAADKAGLDALRQRIQVVPDGIDLQGRYIDNALFR